MRPSLSHGNNDSNQTCADSVHRKLTSKAALEGLSLSEYLLREVQAIAERPSTAGLRARIEALSSIKTRQSMAKAIRAERD